MIKKIAFLAALALFMYVARHTYIIEETFRIYPVGETVGYWLQYVIIAAILLFRKK